MRGKVPCSGIALHPAGITPAYAGKSAFSSAFCPASEDHPRLCGEKYPTIPCKSPVIGSPPPMRGKADHLTLQPHDVGITPAYAGKSRVLFEWTFPMRDHPRLCGEKHGAPKRIVCVNGSPPPMRGKEGV